MIPKNSLFLVLVAGFGLCVGFEVSGMQDERKNEAKRPRVPSYEDILLQEAEERDIERLAQNNRPHGFDKELAVDSDWSNQEKEILRDTLKKIKALKPTACPPALPCKPLRAYTPQNK